MSSPETRFWSKVNKNGPVPAHRPDLGPCWLWTGGQNGVGYGMFWCGGRKVLAHRFAYELLVGPIPPGLQIDHLCRVRCCVRHGHLEPVTHQENALRGDAGLNHRSKTNCPQGHPYDAENTYLWRGQRRCRACWPLSGRRYRDRRRVAACP